MVNRVAFNPPPGLILGETDYSVPGQWCAGSNVRFVNGKPQPVGGWDQLATSIGTAQYVVAMLEWVAKDGVRRLALGCTDQLSVIYGPTLSSQATITLTPFTATNFNRWSFDLWGDHLISCISGGKIGEWSLVAATPSAAVTNAPTQNTVALVTHTRQLMALGTKEEASGTFNPRCIRWSTTEDNTVWTTLPSNLAGEYILDGASGSIKAAKKIGTFVAVWTDDELFLGRYTSDPLNPWVFEKQATGCGCGGIDSVTVADGVVYWITPDLRLKMWIPGAPPVDIPGIPTTYITDSSSAYSTTLLNLSVVWHNRKYNEIWFHCALAGGTFPTNYVAVSVPSIQSDRPLWFTGTMQRSSMYQGINGCYGYSSFALKLLQHETSKTGYYLSPGVYDTLSCSIEALVYLDEGQNRVQIQRLLPDVESQTGNLTFTLSAMDYPQGAEATLQTKTLAVGDDKTDFRAGGKLFRFKFSSDDGGNSGSDTFWRLGKMTFEFVNEGER
jgi:hypothetical protein